MQSPDYKADKSILGRFFGHIKTVSIHKYYVAQGCFRLGLYKQGLLHDMSKFSLSEFIPSVRYYNGYMSPNNIERRLYGYSRAWLHHKGRNKHHFEYWIDFSLNPAEKMIGCKMPMRYVAEMICDRRAACIAYNGSKYTNADAWNYYYNSRHRLIMNKDTRAVLEKALYVLKEEGEAEMFSYVKGLLNITKGLDYDAESLGLKYSDID
ncbi:MAG: DUF5662 family protein [Eubacteriales bacterium]|nr:DUF5662 family protein [Eubacteriales bacterium]